MNAAMSSRVIINLGKRTQAVGKIGVPKPFSKQGSRGLRNVSLYRMLNNTVFILSLRELALCDAAQTLDHCIFSQSLYMVHLDHNGRISEFLP